MGTSKKAIYGVGRLRCLPPPPPSRPVMSKRVRIYTQEDLAAHSTAESCWISHNGKVLVRKRRELPVTTLVGRQGVRLEPSTSRIVVEVLARVLGRVHALQETGSELNAVGGEA